MNPEVPLEISDLPPRLRSDFTGKLPEAVSGEQEERERNFLTRALAAFTVQRLSGCTLDEAATSVVDGGGDGGIDAVFYSAASHTLWIVQSKFIADGRGQVDLGDATKFKTGIENLLQGQFQVFKDNQSLQKLIPSLVTVFKDSLLQVRAILVYSGTGLLAEDRIQLFEDVKMRFSAQSDYFAFRSFNLTSVHDWLIDADKGPGISEVSLKVLKPGWVLQPYETVYGLLSVADLAKLYKDHGKKLIAANIRGYKGKTEVNAEILTTVVKEPQYFFYLNNGLTAYCQRLEVNNLDRANAEEKKIRAFGFSIVNGAQTLGSIAKCFGDDPDPPPQGYVFIKVVSLERCEDDIAFAHRITRSTNFQNEIGSRDFASLDAQQDRIAGQLVLSGIHYHYKDAVDVPTPDETNFTLDEATTALACLEQIQNCDFSVRVLVNRRSLWSFDQVYDGNSGYRSHYERVFRSERSARTVWRSVQAQRIVLETMRNNARASTGVRKAFFENARWLVLNLVYLRVRPEQGDLLNLGQNEHTSVTSATIEIAEVLWSTCESQGLVSRRPGITADEEPYEQPRHFRSVFGSAADCERLRQAVLGILNKPELDKIRLAIISLIGKFIEQSQQTTAAPSEVTPPTTQ